MKKVFNLKKYFKKSLSVLLALSTMVIPINMNIVHAKALTNTSYPKLIEPVYSYSQVVVSDVIVSRDIAHEGYRAGSKGPSGSVVTLTRESFNFTKVEAYISGTFDIKTIGVLNAKFKVTINKGTADSNSISIPLGPYNGVSPKNMYRALYRPYYTRHKLTIKEYVRGPGVNMLNRTFTTYIDVFNGWDTTCEPVK